MMSEYSTISVPRPLHDELRNNIKGNARLGYSSIAEFCKEAIRLHMANIRRERRGAFIERLDLDDLFKQVGLLAQTQGGEYRASFERSQNPSCLVAPDGTISNCNAAFIDALGYTTKEQLLGTDIATVFISTSQLNQLMIRTGEGDVQNQEVQLQRRDGKSFDFLMSVGTIWDNDQIRRYVMTGTDITLQKKIESNMQRENALFRTLLNEIYDTIAVIQDNKIKYAAGQTTISGYTTEELVGMKLSELLSPEGLEKAQRRYEQAIQGKDIPSITTYNIKCKDGILREVEAATRVITYEGKPALLSVFRAEQG